MKNKLILSILFILTTVCYSQNNINGVITYSVNIGDNPVYQKSDAFRDMYNNAIKGAKRIKIKLTFNDSISKFENENIGIKENDYLDAIAWANCSTIYYSNNSRKEYFFDPSENNSSFFKKGEFVVSDKFQNDWIISNETKKINDFTCIKATRIKKISDKFSRNIIAWFCPQIPISIGPQGYYGLPGLIMELQENNIVFGIIEIKLNTNPKFEVRKSLRKIDLKTFEDISKLRREKSLTNGEDNLLKK